MPHAWPAERLQQLFINKRYIKRWAASQFAENVSFCVIAACMDVSHFSSISPGVNTRRGEAQPRSSPREDWARRDGGAESRSRTRRSGNISYGRARVTPRTSERARNFSISLLLLTQERVVIAYQCYTP